MNWSITGFGGSIRYEGRRTNPNKDYNIRFWPKYAPAEAQGPSEYNSVCPQPAVRFIGAAVGFLSLTWGLGSLARHGGSLASTQKHPKIRPAVSTNLETAAC